jgi:hypothetical protein
MTPSDDRPLVDVLVDAQRGARAAVDALALRLGTGPVVSTDELDARTAAVREVRRTVIADVTLKRRLLWPAIEEHVVGGRAILAELGDLARRVEVALIALRWGDERSSTMEPLLMEVVGRAGALLSAEDAALPRIVSQIPASRQAEIAAAMVPRPRGIPSLPHPDLPLVVTTSRWTGPVVALLDRVRDRFSTALG